MLIDDMGGHGRALEALGESVRNIVKDGEDLNNDDYIDLINNVRSKLIVNYQGWLSKTISPPYYSFTYTS